MVQKKGKHGIRTGNTVRAVNTKYIRRYRKDAQIIQREATLTYSDHTDVSTDVTELADISCADLFFSLNKKKRWMLPELLAEEQAAEEFGLINFELVERHKLFKNSNCRRILKSYIGSHEDKDEIVKKTTHIIPNNYYVDADNVLNSQSIYSKHYNKLFFLSLYQSTYPDEDDIGTEIEKAVPGKDEDTYVELEEDKCNKDAKNNFPRVRYEMYCPCEKTNVLTLKPKHIGNDTKKTFKCRNYNRRPWTLQGYQFRSSLAKGKRDDIYNEIREGLEDYTLERNGNKKHTPKKCENYTHKDGKKGAVKALVLSDLQHLSETEPINDGKAKENANQTLFQNNKNTSAVFLSPEDEAYVSKTEAKSDDDEEMISAFFPRKITLLPVCVLLQQEEINVSKLDLRYGEDFLECRCRPRRFIINISKYIQDLDLEGIGSTCKLLRIMNKMMFCWLIFSHDPTHKLNNKTERAFDVSVNAHLTENVASIRIEGLVEDTIVSIATVIEKTISYFRSLPRESMIFERKQNLSKYRPLVHHQSILAELKHWSSWTYIPDNLYVMNRLTESAKKFCEEIQSVIPKRHDKSTHTLCFICFRKTHSMMALCSCYHFFCSACWEAYIYGKNKEGYFNIYCPQEDCDEIVDIGTIISVLSVKDILTFARRRHDFAVEKNKLAKWCTNETCGRVIVVNVSRSKFVRCQCGESLCFMCSGSPHWPLPCKKYLDYIKILLETRDKNISPHDFVIKFDVKYCLICFKVVKHYDRCGTKDCPCGGILCFRCSYLWHARNMLTNHREHTTASSKSRESCTSVLAAQRNAYILNKRTKWYKLAMKHRLNQHPYRLAKILANSKLLANRISHYVLREERKGNYLNIGFTDADTCLLRESERVTQFMRHIVQIYIETSNIIENTAFSLNDEIDTEHEANELLHRRAMILSTCAKSIFDLIKDGAFLNPKIVIKRLTDTNKEIRRVMECIVKEL